jgi:predicted MPP superfamily phosphohydrolase
MKPIYFFFGLLLLGFSISFQYTIVRLTQLSGFTKIKKILFILLFSFFFVFVILGMISIRQFPERVRDYKLLAFTIDLGSGFLVTIIFYTFFSDFLFLVQKIWTRFKNNIILKQDKIDQGRRRFMFIGTLSLGSVAVGHYKAQSLPDINHVVIKIKNLPKEFSGFKIAQISDLHVGPIIGKQYVDRVVEITNALSPDMIVLTGDMIDGPVELIKNDILSLGQLKAAQGVYLITGNHEYYWDVEAWLSVFRKMGIRILLNEHVIISKNTSNIILAGVTDYEASHHLDSHQSDPFKSVQNSPDGLIKILLAHQPKSYWAANEAQFDLQISGHTHGGQFFPWNIFVSLIQPYYRGLNRYKKLQIYTSTGTGYWGPPLRLAVPNEIALIELQPE